MLEFVGSLARGADAAFGAEEKLHEELRPEDVQHFAHYHEGVVEGAGFGGQLGDVGHHQSRRLQRVPEQVEAQVSLGFLPRIVDERRRRITLQPGG